MNPSQFIRGGGILMMISGLALAFPLAGMLTVVGYALLGWAWKKSSRYPTRSRSG